MTSMWQKTLFYLGLVDDEQLEAAEATEHAPQANQAAVRTVESPPAREYRSPEPSQPAMAPRVRGAVPGRRVEPPSTQRRRISANPVHAEAGVLVTRPDESSSAGSGPQSGSPTPSGIDPAPGPGATVLTATKFSDAQQLADHLRQGEPVVLDLRTTEPAMVRRLVDFSSGLTYALDGTMRKIGQGVILVSPPGSAMTVEELRRLADLGLYEARDLS